MSHNPMTAQDKREWQAYLDLKRRISSSTAAPPLETPAKKIERTQTLLKHPDKFFQYYFPHYMDSAFGWFHLKAIRAIAADPNCFLVAEWAREHAKSVLFDVMVPLWLLARGELTGMILASASEDKAKGLLKDVQAELEANRRYISDFGEQRPLGGWTDGHFSTLGGVGFWGFGLGQNPAGVREAEKRPNYGVIDDADDKRKAKNQQRIQEDLDWCLGEFFGCLSIRGARKVYANNRVHREGLTAHIVGDVKPGDRMREGIVHIKVYATEDPRTHKMLLPDAGGVPAWKERYTVQMIQARMRQLGHRNAMRQFFHHHIEEGFVFTEDMIQWTKPLPWRKYEKLVSYNDPSWKGTAKNDFKAIVLVGKIGPAYHVLWAWVRQTAPATMVDAHYLLAAQLGDTPCDHYIEANLMQDQHMQHYRARGQADGVMLRIRPDERKKPDKADRIADLEPLFQLGLIQFSETERSSPDMQRLIEQLLGFPYDPHDDGPDALEGAIYQVNRTSRSAKFKPIMGNTRYNLNRRA